MNYALNQENYYIKVCLNGQNIQYNDVKILAHKASILYFEWPL